MTSSDLKYKIEQSGHELYFFSRETMTLFGDSMRNYGVRESVIDTYSAQQVPVYELFRRRPVKHGLQSSAYFRRDTLTRVFPEKEQP